jgi:hypothetical protein
LFSKKAIINIRISLPHADYECNTSYNQNEKNSFFVKEIQEKFVHIFLCLYYKNEGWNQGLIYSYNTIYDNYLHYYFTNQKINDLYIQLWSKI